MINDL
jgi:hypothetical protein